MSPQATPVPSLLARAVLALRAPILAVVERTLLGPLHLGPAVVALWGVTRDLAWGLLTAVLLLGVVDAQWRQAVDPAAPPPWALLPRLLVAALGVTLSLPAVRLLLQLNNLLTALLVGAAPGGGHPGGLLASLGAGLLLGAAPVAVLAPGVDVVALLLLAGLAALACFYLVRAAEIVLLTLALPLAAALWILPAAAGLWRALWAELVVAVFVQSAQALVLLVFAAGVAAPASGAGAWLWGFAALTMLLRVRALLARGVGLAGQWAERGGGRWAPALGRLLDPRPGMGGRRDL